MWLRAVFNWFLNSLLGIAVVLWERRLVGFLRSWIFSFSESLGSPCSVLLGGQHSFQMHYQIINEN